MTTLTLMALVGILVTTSTGCRRPRDGSRGSNGSAGRVVVVEPSDTTLTDAEDLPGLVFTVLEVNGASGDGDAFQVGDQISVTFTVTRNDGSALAIEEVDRFEVNVSGPTFNYQRVIGKINVIPSIGEVPEEIEHNEDGSYTYTFPELPEFYIDPPNYLATNTTDVLTGTDLLSGTYTFVFVGYKNYTVGDKVEKDVANVTYDFLFGSATVLEPREVVTAANCAQCHDTLQYHDRGLDGGGRRRDVRTCVTCHVAGSEDWNDVTVAGGTPGATVEFKVMIHKIHNSENLPSVLGIATDPTDGSRDYMAVPVPYELVSDELEIHEYEVQFPVWPNLNIRMPRDYGYTWSEDAATTALAMWEGTAVAPDTNGWKAIGSAQSDGSPVYGTPALNGRTWRSNDDLVRGGVTDCGKCHGDPDGAGPLAAPAQGNLAYTQPSRRACGSCHDDVDWDGNYRSNLKTMAAQSTDADCADCHVAGTDPKLDTINAHVHPVTDPAQMPTNLQGINVDIIDVESVDLAGGASGCLDPGEKLAITMTVRDDAGVDILLVPPPYPGLPKMATFPTPIWPAYPYDATATGFWSTLSCVVAGPTKNYNLLNYVTIPMLHPEFNGGIPVDGEYTLNVPEIVLFERLGVATGVADVWTTARQNHLNIPFYAPTFVIERTALATFSTTIASPVTQWQSWVDVTNGAAGNTDGWAKNQMVCLNDGGGTEEYLRIQYVQNDVNGTTNERLWFTSPYAQNSVGSSANATGYPAAGALPTSGTTWYGPWARTAHTAGQTANRVTVNVVLAPAAYTLGGPNNNTITEAGAATFTTGNTILCCYTGDWVLPSTYPINFNDSSDLNETWGEWQGKRIVPGTYTVGVWTRYPWRHFDLTDTPTFVQPLPVPAGVDPTYNYEVNSYPITSPPGNADFLVNNPVFNPLPYLVPVPTEIEPYEILDSHGDTCNECHNDMWFHGGGRRGFDTCILCHGLAGTEDWPQYRSTSAILPTTGTTISFRTMLHKLHHGEELYYSSTYYVTGNSGSSNWLGGIKFPTMPGGTKNCAKCHGEPELEVDLGTWEVPVNRNHPFDQTLPVREYKVVCNSCHDSGDATAHMDLMTSSAGEESCATCHGPGKIHAVEFMHRPR